MSRPRDPSRGNHRPLALRACAVALLLASAPVHAQERSATAPDTIPVVRSDSTAADSLRHGIPLPHGRDLPEVFRRPPPDTRAPWPLGPKNRYAHTGVLVGAAAGTLLSLAEGRHPVPGALFSGLLGYVVGMFFD